MGLIFLDQAPPPPARFAVPGLIPAEGLTLIVGAEGSGKSMLAAELAVAVATGGQWAGRAVLRGSVLYVAPERPAVTHRRIAAMIGTSSAIAIAPDRIDLRGRGAIEALRSDAERVARHADEPLALIVIDTWAAASPGLKENEASETQAIASELTRLAGDLSVPIVILHHASKGEASPRGSTALPAAADAILMVRSRSNGEREIVPDKLSDGPPAGRIKFRIEKVAGSPRVCWTDSRSAGHESAGAVLSRDQATILAAADSVRIRHPNATRSDLRDEVFARLGPRSENAKKVAFSSGVKLLVSKGLISPDDPIVSVSKGGNSNGPNGANGGMVSVSVSAPPLIEGRNALTCPKPKRIGRRAISQAAAR
ncbi:AAA family ATPase [Bosea vestrisii]|uniref:AAA family ATPase n=1 Tax=Bosea vestrisii TaxID=151416 RepID=A0ABW0H4G1_9HYPH